MNLKRIIDRYFRRFFVDCAFLSSLELGVEEKHKPVIEKTYQVFRNRENLISLQNRAIVKIYGEKTLTFEILLPFRPKICIMSTSSFLF